jgi:hypothetical protein
MVLVDGIYCKAELEINRQVHVSLLINRKLHVIIFVRLLSCSGIYFVFICKSNSAFIITNCLIKFII